MSAGTSKPFPGPGWGLRAHTLASWETVSCGRVHRGRRTPLSMLSSSPDCAGGEKPGELPTSALREWRRPVSADVRTWRSGLPPKCSRHSPWQRTVGWLSDLHRLGGDVGERRPPGSRWVINCSKFTLLEASVLPLNSPDGQRPNTKVLPSVLDLPSILSCFEKAHNGP